MNRNGKPPKASNGGNGARAPSPFDADVGGAREGSGEPFAAAGAAHPQTRKGGNGGPRLFSGGRGREPSEESLSGSEGRSGDRCRHASGGLCGAPSDGGAAFEREDASVRIDPIG